jgi:hypothetical protein
MGTTLTGTFISQTFDALIKVTDNDNLTSTAKRLTDGLGNDSPLFLSTTKLGVGITPTTTFQVSGNSQLGGNLTVTGNLIVQGTTTTVDTDTLSVKDPLIIVGSDNTSSDAVDLGFYGVYDTSGSLDLYAGLFRDASDAKFHLFKDLQTEPTTTVNKNATGYTKAGLVVGALEATTGSFTGNIELQAASGFAQVELGGPSGAIIDLKKPFSDDYDLRLTTATDSEITASGTLKLNAGNTLTLTLDGSNQSATFAGDLTVSGGDIILGGTGRIQGIDTVSASTDAANKAYVDAQITAQDLDFAGDSNTGSVDLDSQTFTIAGTTNEIETSASGQTLTVGLPSTVAITTKITSPIFGLGEGTSNKIQFIGSNGNWRINISDSANQFVIHSESLVADYFTVIGGGGIKLNAYGSGSKTGTVAKNLAVDSSGNIIETDGGVVDGSGTANDVAMWSDSNTLTDAPIAISGNDATFAGSIIVNSTGFTKGGHKISNYFATDAADGEILNLGVTGNIGYIQSLNGTTPNTLRLDGSSIAFRTGSFSTALTLDSSQNATFAGDITATSKKFISTSSSSGDYVRLYAGSGTAQWDIYGSGENLRLSENSSGGGIFQVDSGATFGGLITTTSTSGIKIDTTGNAILELDGASGSTEAIIFRHSGTEVSRISHSNSTNLVFSTGSSVTTALTLDGSNQSATFTNDVTIDNSSPEFYLTPDSAKYSWMIAAQENVDQHFEITPSTTVGGSTFNAPALKINGADNAATFAGDVTLDNSGSGDRTLTISTTTGGDPIIVMNSDASNRSGLIRYQDNGTNIGRIEYVHNGDKLQFQAGSATGQILELTNSAATFAGGVSINHGSGDTLTLTKSTTEPSLRIEGDTDKDFVITVSGELLTFTQNDGATDILKLDHDTKNATFAANITAAGTLEIGTHSAFAIKLQKSDGTYQPFAATSGNHTYLYNNDAAGSYLFRNAADSSTLFELTNAGVATFAGSVTITQNSGSLEFSNTGSGHGSITTGSSKDLNIGSASGNVFINNNTIFAGDVSLTGSGDKIISAISSDDDATLFLSGAGSGKDVHIVYGNDRALFISKSSSATATSEGTPVLTLAANSTATFAGTIESTGLNTFKNSVGASTDLDSSVLKLQNTLDGGSGIEFINSVAGKSKISFGVESSGAGTDDTFLAFSTSANATMSEKMRIDSSGNVTIRDGKKLILNRPDNAIDSEISTNSAGTLILNSRNGEGFNFQNAGSSSMRIDSSGTTKIIATKAYGSETATLRVATSPTGTNFSDGAFSNIVFGDETIANNHLGEIQVNQINASSSTASDMRFFTNSGGGNTATAERMRIDSSGLVRIQKNTASTTEPLLKLSNANGSTTDGVKMIFEVANTSGNGGEIAVVRDGGSFNPYMTFNVSSGVSSAPSERMRIRSSGTVGIGAEGFDSQMLTIAAGTLDGAIYATSTDANCFASFRDNSSTANIEFGAIGNNHVFRKDATEHMRITSDGGVAIGTTSLVDTNILHIKSSADTDFPTFKIETGSTTRDASMSFVTNGGNTFCIGVDASDSDKFKISDNSILGTNDRLTINSSGHVGIGCSPVHKLQVEDNGNVVRFYNIGSSNATLTLRADGADGTDSGIQVSFRDTSDNAVGSITSTSNATAFNTSSDYRLKENVVEMTGALDRVSQLKPSRFNFIGQENIVDGFLAHEVSDIVPEAITGTKDEVDAEGNPVYQGIDQSKLVPLLVGAIQELQKEIEILKNK